MMRGLTRALRFGWHWKAGAPRVGEEEVEIHRADRTVPGTLFRPQGRPTTSASWVVLHGITRPGRHHPTLLRFARALSASGASVLVPEIPEWRALHLAPEAAADTVRGAVLRLAELELSPPGRMGLMGFSFGVPQAIRAAGDPELAPHLATVAGFGGYCDFQRTLRYLFRGHHEWEGQSYQGEPDPYGRWVVGGNLLPRAPTLQGTEEVAEALLTLAREAGDMQVGAWEGALDGRKVELESALSLEHRELFRGFAPPAGELPSAEFTDRMVEALDAGARVASPLLDPRPLLEKVTLPVRLIHGREDRLIPFSESLRLREAFPPEAKIGVYLTGLFAHSQREGGGSPVGQLREQANFVRMLGDLLGLV